MIDAIALKPLADLPAALNPLQNNVPDPQVLPLLDYFVCTYVNGRPIANTIPPLRSTFIFTPKYVMCMKLHWRAEIEPTMCVRDLTMDLMFW